MVVVVIFSAGAQAAPGDPDLTFSGDGEQTTDFGGFGDDRATGVAVTAHGKVIVVGQAGGGAGGSFFALARYNRNGSLDTSFSGDGRKMTYFRGRRERATGVALQDNGKIVVVGFAGNDLGGDFALARYRRDGSLDTSFAGDGKQRTEFPFSSIANGVAIQDDGKIVVVGGDGNGDFALARYNRNGSLDTSFSGDGRKTTDFYDGDYYEEATGVALQGDGKIVAVGVAGERYYSSLVLARYRVNGSLDSSFSGDGKSGASFGLYNGGAHAVALQDDGKIVAVGGGGDGGDFALARFNVNGPPDMSFSGDGQQTTGSGGQATGVAIQDDQKIVAVGYGEDFGLARYDPNGSLDMGFAGDGKQTTGFVANGVALTPLGNIVVAGYVGSGPNETNDFALARYAGG
jgi:uncharacterized delta-60 repeat protein